MPYPTKGIRLYRLLKSLHYNGDYENFKSQLLAGLSLPGPLHPYC